MRALWGVIINEEKRRLKEVMTRFRITVIEKASPMIIHAAMCISHVVALGLVIKDISKLPQAAKLSIFQDARRLRIFCPTDDMKIVTQFTL